MRPRIDAELVLDLRAEVGEGPIWDSERQRLLWVDVPGGRIHLFHPASGENQTIQLDQPVGVAVPRARGGIVAAVRDGFGFVDEQTGRLEIVAEVEPGEESRMNDGKCDARGRFFAGTMPVSGDRPTGALYRLDPDSRVTRLLEGVTISNGIDWSPDGWTMYYIDSATRRVDVLDYEPATGTPTNRRPLIVFPEEYGLPDGMTVDAEGHLWIGFWDGRAVRRFSPGGQPEAVVELPVSRVTSCCFGGPELATLFITTASFGVADAEPQAGGLFRAKPGVRGRHQHPFEG